MKVKAKCIKCNYQKDDYRIFSWSPIENTKELKLSTYFTFSTKGNDSYITEGNEYELELEEINCNPQWGGTYRITDCPTIARIELKDLTEKQKFEIIMDCTSSERIAKNILAAYPNFIDKVLTEGKESIDTSLIQGVGEAYLNSYVRTLNEKYKYYAILQYFKPYKFDITKCKTLLELYINQDGIEQALNRNPYEVLMSTLKYSFVKADKIIMELRPELKVSEQRCAYLILSVLERNEAEGSTRLNGNDLYYYILNELNVPELEPLIVPTAMNNALFYYDEESKDLSIMSTYNGECLINSFVKDRIKNSKPLNIDWTKYRTIDDFEMSDKQASALEMFCKYNFMILAGYSGSGKAQPTDTIIPTPNGNKRLGDIKIGDYVYDRLGKPTKVLGVYPQGMKDVYTVELSDGRTTQCNDEHLWSYYTSKGNLYTKTLREMIDSGLKNGNINKYKIPTNKPIEIEEKSYNVDPYVIGSFIGNGCCKERKLTISSNDKEQVNSIAILLNSNAKKYTDKNYSWVFENNTNVHNKFGAEIKYLQTTDILPKEICCESFNKSIPNEYKYGSIKQRYDLIQGLFDTDGSISDNAPRFTLSYSTTSKKLVEDIKEVLYSLGYSCSVHTDSRSLYRDDIKNGHICYTINVLCDNNEKEKFFRLKRKKDIALKAREYNKHRNYNQISIANVTKEDYQKEMVCIYVDNDEHLYLTNDYIVTHNTTSLKGIIKLMEDNGLSYTLLAPTGKASRRITESVHRPSSTIHRKCLKDGEIASDVIIIDETSMVDLPTFTMLLNCITNDNVRIVVVGDNAQLMPVGIGCVFNDLINSGIVPMVMLDEVFRYKTNGGLFVATNVRQGKSFFNDNEMVKQNGNVYSVSDNYKFIKTNDIFTSIISEYTALLAKGIKASDILCLSPFNVKDEGTYKINNAIQLEVNPPKPNDKFVERKIKDGNSTVSIVFRVGDRVINKKNDYQALPLESYNEIIESNGVLKEDDVVVTSVFNGQDGIIREIKEDNALIIQFDEELIVFTKEKVENLLLAYCISVHSSQGSESPYVINVVSSKHSRMLNRNLLYVADTRSKKMQIDIGDSSAFESALSIDGNTERLTWLKDLLVTQ